MDWNNYLYPENEKPLDRLACGYSRTSVFRTIAFVGDSLSSGEFETRDAAGKAHYHDLYEYSWGQYIARKNGLTAYNFSKGGMTAKQYIETFAESRGFWSPELAAQAYVIALGVNDVYNKHMPIGSIDDVDVNDWRNNADTFAGYYGAIISRYKEISPEAKFFFVTFPRSDRADREDATREVISLLYRFAELFDNSYVIDLCKYGPLYDGKFRERFYLHGHMTPDGYILTAELIDSYIDYVVRHNPRDFKQTGFINSGIEHDKI